MLASDDQQQPDPLLPDLPDSAIDLIWCSLDPSSRQALHRTCRALRTSPAINRHISQHATLIVQLNPNATANDGELEKALLTTWPRHAAAPQAMRIVSDPESLFPGWWGAERLLGMLEHINTSQPTAAARLTGVKSLEIQVGVVPVGVVCLASSQ